MQGHFLMNHSVCFSNSVRKHVTEIQAAEMGVDPTNAKCSLRHMLERTYIPMPGYATPFLSDEVVLKALLAVSSGSNSCQ